MHVLGVPSGGLPRPRRMALPLIESHPESPTTMTFVFSTEGTGFHYLSNQAIRLVLPSVADPWGAARTFSLSSSPSEIGRIAVTCRMSDTPFKAALAKLRPGDLVEVYGPLGFFLFDGTRPSVFLAGGIGITPFRGMLRYATDTGNTSEKRLLYSARVPEELLFRRELDAMARSSPHFQVHYSVSRPTDSVRDWSGRVGRIDDDWIRDVAGALVHPKFYVAGLPEMVENTLGLLRGPLGILEEDIDYEVFRGF
jgi:glycine betaine catabolism B